MALSMTMGKAALKQINKILFPNASLILLSQKKLKKIALETTNKIVQSLNSQKNGEYGLQR